MFCKSSSLLKLRINACEKIEKHSVCMIFLIKRTTSPEELCILLFDSLMISLVKEITAKSAAVEIPFRKHFYKESVRPQFSLSGGFVTFLERCDLAVK